MNPRDLIEQPTRWHEFDEVKTPDSESGLWVRREEALASLAISLKRIADFLYDAKAEDEARRRGRI